MTESIGMMEGAFFVSKKEILNWVNITFKLSLTSIEQACTGALYCQIVDSIHPGKLKMQKVNWKAKLEHEYLNNFKILQQAFTECKISKNIEVEKLAKGKPQDNLEFLQWLKRYFDINYSGAEYDPEKRRNGADLEVEKKRDNSKSKTDLGNFSKNMNNINVIKNKKKEGKENSQVNGNMSVQTNKGIYII